MSIAPKYVVKFELDLGESIWGKPVLNKSWNAMALEKNGIGNAKETIGSGNDPKTLQVC